METPEAFRASDLGRSIGTAYEVEGEPQTEFADMTLLVDNRAVNA
jgi:hypothetical protein